LWDHWYDRRHINAGGGVRPISFNRIGAVIAAQRQDRSRGFFSNRDSCGRNSCGLRRTAGDLRQGGAIGFVNGDLLRWQ
jgi:hypothetical protein